MLYRQLLVMCSLAATLLGSGCAEQTPVASTPQTEETLPTESKTPTLAEGVMTDFEAGFQSIQLADLVVFSSEAESEAPTWSEEQGVLICTGKPKGYAHTTRSYADFVLRYDYRFEPSERHRQEGKLDFSNTGVLCYITGDDQIWPKSIEVQGKHLEMASIKENGGIPAVEIDDHPDKREAARKPAGEWNSIEVVSEEGVLTTYLNGEQICQNKPGEVNNGRIGFQAEGFEVHFRNIRIKETE